MSPAETPIRPMARVYLFLLRTSGWWCLALLPLFGFAVASGYVRDQGFLWIAIALATPGLLTAVFLAGTPDRPTFLLRPTQFFKAFFVCGFFLQIVWMLSASGAAMLSVAIDLPRLVSDLGLGVVLQTAEQVVVDLKAQGVPLDISGEKLHYMVLIFLLLSPAVLVNSINGYVVWFARFPKVQKSAAQAAYEETLARAQAQQDADEKADAMAALHARLARPRAT